MKARISNGLLPALWVLGSLLVTLVMVGVLLLASVPAFSGTNPGDGTWLVEARQALEQELRSAPGFVGIAHCEERGEIVVFLESEQAQRLVDSRFRGYSVRTEITGRFRALAVPVADSAAPSQVDWVSPDRAAIVRPLVGGISVSAYIADKSWRGTLGMVTYDNKILSNAHVIAMDFENNFLPPGTPVIQPGSADRGGLDDRVGGLEDYILIDFSPGAVNYADAAIGIIDGGISVSPGEQFAEGGNYWVEGWTEVAVGDTVRKSGWATGITTGEVAYTDYACWVDYDGESAYFDDQIVVDGPFSACGDSGSAVDKDGEFVGLVFAGNGDYSIVCKASYIIDGLGIAVEPTGVEQPGITVDPTSFDVTMLPDTIWTDTLTIGNTGGADLTYDISDGAYPWLDVSPDSGSVAPGGSDQLTVTVDTSGLAPGDYIAEIVIASNDPDKNLITVPVTLQVSRVRPTVITRPASGVGDTSATLNMDYTLGGYSTVNVRFAYKKAAGADWSHTAWVGRSEEASHAETLSALDTATLYDFKAQLHYGTVQIEGAVLQFTTDVEPPNDFVDNPPIEEGLASIADDLIIVLLWQPATQSWDVYFPVTGDDTIGTMEAGRAYWIYVDTACTLEYGTRTIELYAGWNNPPWPAQ